VAVLMNRLLISLERRNSPSPDSVLVKKLQKVAIAPDRIRLVSLNPEYLPIDVAVNDIQELWMVNSKLTFGINEPSESGLLRQLQQSMEDLKGQISNLKA